MRWRNFCWKNLETPSAGLSCAIRMPKGAQPGWERLSLGDTRPNAPAEPACEGKCPCPALVDTLKTQLGEKELERRAWLGGISMSPTLPTALRGGPPPEEGIVPREQHKSWDPNCCLLASLIKADLHFYEWLAAARKENSNKPGYRQAGSAGQGEGGGRGWQISPCPSSAILDVHSELSLLVLSPSLGLSENTALSSCPPTHARAERCANTLQTPPGSILAMQSGRAATGVAMRGHQTAGDNLSRVLRPGLWDGWSGRACCARPLSHRLILCGFEILFPFFFLPCS